MPTINDPAIVAEVKSAFEAYEAALVANDVPALQNFFWDSPEAVRFGVGEQLYGAAQINAFRQNRVINFTHRRGLRLTVTTFGSDTASVMFEFVSLPAQIERQGRQSQVWQRLEGVWKIVSAHVSLAPLTLMAGPDWTLFVKQAAAAQHLSIDPAFEAGVTRNLSVIAELVEPLLNFALPDHLEPAPVFTP